MLNMNKKLEQREKEGTIIKCGIVGAGQMGRGMVTQMVLMKGITPAVVSDIDLELAVHAFKYAGVKDADIVRTNDTAEADRAMDEGKYVATTNSNLISQCRPVEVAIDATGVPDVGAKVATDAIKNKKHDRETAGNLRGVSSRCYPRQQRLLSPIPYPTMRFTL